MQQQTIPGADDTTDVVFKAYCKNHTKKRQMMQPNVENDEVDADVEEEEEEEENAEEATQADTPR